MVAGSVRTTTLFTLVWGLERFTLTLSNICMVAFLTNLSYSIHMAVIGSIYMVIQCIPVAICALYVGPWLDVVERGSAVPRAILVKICSVAVTLFVSGVVAFFNIHQGGIFVILPMLIILIVGTSMSGAMHIIIHLSTERLWLVAAANREANSSKFLARANGLMSIAFDVSQVFGLMLFGPLTKDMSPFSVYLIAGSLFLVLSSVELVCFRKLDTMLPPQMSQSVVQRRSVRLSFVDYWSQRDTPVGICWAARSTFTSLWFATTVIHHSPIGVLYRWFYFVTSIATSLGFVFSLPRIAHHVVLIGVAGAEIVSLLLATIPVLSQKLSVYDMITNSTLVDMLELNVEQMTSIALTEIVPQIFTVSIYVLLALSVVISSASNRLWNLTALQIYQETVSAQCRGSVGGVQIFLDYTALSFHGLLAFTAHGKGYAWMCAGIGLSLSLFNLLALLWWRRVKIASSERVTLLKREITTVDLPKE